MGLSASQARLLSITARLSDNELKSQQISNSKVRLADKSQEASRNYIAALDASKMMYSTYDAQGNPTKVDLTAATLYSYSPYKSQYTLVNSSNQLLVSALDAQNFQETSSLQEFLARYDLVDEDATKQLEEDYNGASLTYSKSNDIYNAIEQIYKDWTEKTAATDSEGNATDSFSLKYKTADFATALDNYNKSYDTTDATDATLANKDAYIEGFKKLVSYETQLNDYNTKYSEYETKLKAYNKAKSAFYAEDAKKNRICESDPDKYLEQMKGEDGKSVTYEDLDVFGKYFYDLALYNKNTALNANEKTEYDNKKAIYDFVKTAYEANPSNPDAIQALVDAKLKDPLSTDEHYYDEYGYVYAFMSVADMNAGNKANDLFHDFIFTTNDKGETVIDSKNGGFCYDQALNGNTYCYRHLLAHLLDWDVDNDEIDTNTVNSAYNTTDNKRPTSKNYTTTTGQEFTLKKTDFTGAGMHTNAKKEKDAFRIIIRSINNPYRTCDGKDYDGSENSLKDTAYKDATTVAKLMSDWKYATDKNGKIPGSEGYEATFEVKSLKEKIKDMFYLLQIRSTDSTNANYVSKEDMNNLLIDFTESDLATSYDTIPSEPEKSDPLPASKPSTTDVDAALEKPEYNIKSEDVATKPSAPTAPETYKKRIIVNDQAKAQWYTNLWYRMNGSDTANIVTALNDGDVIGEESLFTKTQYYIYATSTNKGSKTYTTFDETLFKDSEWLQFALEQGIVSIQKAQYYDPSEDNGKVISASGEGIMWNRMTYSSCSEFVSVDDEVAIAKAEAEYNQALNEIQAQDKKLDNDLKKLDTEHNALQTEYESVKSVVDKNIERSFKAFS